METKTIDERIREKARNELAKEIQNKISDRIQEFFDRAPNHIHVKIDLDKDGTIHICRLIDPISDAIMASLGPKSEDAAVKEFIMRFDEFSNQLEELRSEVVNKADAM